MRAMAILCLLVLSGCSQQANEAPKPPAVPAPPVRKPGLWEQRVSNGDFVQISRICLDAATDARMSLWGAQATKDLCGGNTMTPLPGGGWSFSSTCDMGTGGKTTTSGTATGDFNVKYLVQAKSVTEGAAAPQMNGPHTVNIEAAWQGPCPAGTKPGDMTLPGGIKVNLLDLGVAK